MNWLVILLFSAFFVAMKKIIIKNCLKKEHTFPLLFWISVAMVFSCTIFYHKIDLVIPAYAMVLVIGKSIILAIAWYLVLHVLKKMDISLLDPITNLSPLFLVVLSFFILGERLTPIQYIGIMVIISGIYYLEFLHGNSIFEPFKKLKDKNMLLVLCSLVLISICAISDKIILKYINFYTLFFYNYLFLAIIYLAVILKKGYVSDLVHVVKKDYHYVLVIMIVSFFADLSYFYVVAMPNIAISLIIPIKRLSTLITSIIGGFFFHESSLWHRASSCGLMILGVYFLVM